MQVGFPHNPFFRRVPKFVRFQLFIPRNFAVIAAKYEISPYMGGTPYMQCKPNFKRNLPFRLRHPTGDEMQKQEGILSEKFR